MSTTLTDEQLETIASNPDLGLMGALAAELRSLRTQRDELVQAIDRHIYHGGDVHGPSVAIGSIHRELAQARVDVRAVGEPIPATGEPQ